MKRLKIGALWFLRIVVVLYVTILLLFYFYQEKVLFYPQKLPADYVFDYKDKFDEVYPLTTDNTKLHGLLFKADSARGLVFYLHGNAGSLRKWGRVAMPFLANNYDCFVLDYRGYGKSEGEISSESQLLDDVNTVYKKLIKRYSQENVIVVGYSIGTGPAAYIASKNNPSLLILKAPYYNMNYMRELYYSWIPAFGMRYKLTTNKYLEKVNMPVIIFHGDNDQLIPYESALKLKEEFNENDTLITLLGQGHNGMSKNKDYIKSINWILSEI